MLLELPGVSEIFVRGLQGGRHRGIHRVEVGAAGGRTSYRVVRATGQRWLEPRVPRVVHVPEVLHGGWAVRVAAAGVRRRRKDDAWTAELLAPQPAVAR